ncbi:MAG: EAL domain-containing protein [Oscillospiraceae bacterium]
MHSGGSVPDFVKLDIAIVRNIHADNNRLQVLRNLVSYSRERGIRVIAEGVECQEEMEVLIEKQGGLSPRLLPQPPRRSARPLPEDIVGSIRAAAARRTEP